jgi:hypothetical protein
MSAQDADADAAAEQEAARSRAADAEAMEEQVSPEERSRTPEEEMRQDKEAAAKRKAAEDAGTGPLLEPSTGAGGGGSETHNPVEPRGTQLAFLREAWQKYGPGMQDKAQLRIMVMLRPCDLRHRRVSPQLAEAAGVRARQGARTRQISL